MNCRDAERHWNERLDGDGGEPSADLQAHLKECQACRALFAAIEPFRRALSLARRPEPPTDLASRITARLLAEHGSRLRWRQRVVWSAVGLAASVALAALVGWRWLSIHPFLPPPLPPGDPIVHLPLDKVLPDDVNRSPRAGGTSLRDEVASAGQALATLVGRTADDTVSKGRLLLPTVPSAVLPPASADVWRVTFEPPARSLREAGQGVSSGLEPVAESARRAVSMLFSHVPTMEDEP
jgi:predicted anti-sigma-YlaC factor YlaD